jgi:protein SCO1/2
MRAFLIGLILSLTANAAHAGLSERDLAGVSLAPPPGATVPLDLLFRDLSGQRLSLKKAIDNKPALLVLVDFTCRTICGPALMIASSALAETGLRATNDYRLIVVGLDPKDTATDALAMLGQIEDPAVAAATTVLSGDAAAVRALTAAIGYKFTYDADADQFAHPAGTVVITGDGRVSRVLSSLALNPLDLRLALVEAGQGRTGSLADRLTLLCYGFDAVHGIYTALIWRVLEAAASLTILVLAGSILVFQRRRLRSLQEHTL